MSEIKRYDEYVKRCLTKEEYIKECYGGLPNESMLAEQWQKLPIVKIGYDSEIDTLKHIKRVSQLLAEASIELLRRSTVHDNSKLKSPEKELFDEYTPKLATTTYGSDEYKELLKGLKVAPRS